MGQSSKKILKFYKFFIGLWIIRVLWEMKIRIWTSQQLLRPQTKLWFTHPVMVTVALINLQGQIKMAMLDPVVLQQRDLPVLAKPQATQAKPNKTELNTVNKQFYKSNIIL